jgi:peptidoglycan/LPS O-acetylase OafA/YrhL
MKRITELDSLRGIAALAVVLFHYTVRYGQVYEQPSELLLRFNNGYLGVNLFFIISGFVIFMTLEKTRHGLDFVVSRFSRLYPTYWSAVLITFFMIGVLGLPGREVSTAEMTVNLTMVPELFHVRPVDGVYWTLQVELFFYLLMFCLFLANLLPRIQTIIGVWVLLPVVDILVSQYFGFKIPYRIQQALVLEYIPFFAIGIICYRLYQGTKETVSSYSLITLSVVSVLITDGLEVAVAALLMTAVFVLFIMNRLSFLGHPVLVFLGTISYPLYLVHQHIGYAVLTRLYSYAVEPHLAIVLTIGLAVLISTVLTFAVEKPVMRFIRDRYL